MSVAPKFIITDVGLAAASVASAVGPFVHITGFRIGSGYGYVAQPTDTDINGVLLYEDVPLSYRYIGDNTIDILCRISADAGPFDFGEVAVDLAGPVMFAKAVFETPQTKYTSLGTNVLSTYTFHCLLKLSQPVAIFKIDTSGAQPDIWEVDLWSDIYPPALMANPGIPSILVRELDNHGNSSLIHQASDEHWTLGTNYHFWADPIIAGSTTTTVDILESSLTPYVSTVTDKEYVLQTHDGYFRSVSSVTLSGGVYTFHLNADALSVAPSVGSPISLYSSLPVQPTALTLSGDASGAVLLSGGNIDLSVTLNALSIKARQATFDTEGVHHFIVPPNVTRLFVDYGSPGGGAGGAGGGRAVERSPNDDYVGGGGGGGGGAGETELAHELVVTPGEDVVITIGPKGTGGLGGNAPGVTGDNGTDGGTITIQTLLTTITLPGGTGGKGGSGYGLPSGLTGAGGAPGLPGGFFGTDGAVGGAGGNGGSSPFGTGGPGGRGAAINVGTGVPGDDGTGNCSGGGGAGAVYAGTATTTGAPGGDGTDGYARFTW